VHKDDQQLLEKVVQKDDQQLLDDEYRSFIKMLCDDIYVCLQTFETKYSAMYSCARQVSQGSQRSYSANYTPSQKQRGLSDNITSPKLMRSYALNSQLDEYDEDSVFRPMFPEMEETRLNSSFNLSLKKPPSDCNSNDNVSITRFRDYDSEFNSNENDLDDAAAAAAANDDYKVSEQIDNPYISQSILEMMRSCSASIDDYK
jgi:hypothetical protein